MTKNSSKNDMGLNSGTPKLDETLIIIGKSLIPAGVSLILGISF